MGGLPRDPESAGERTDRLAQRQGPGDVLALELGDLRPQGLDGRERRVRRFRRRRPFGEAADALAGRRHYE